MIRRFEAKRKAVLLSLLVSGFAVLVFPSTAQAQSDGEFFRCIVTENYLVDDAEDSAGQVRPMREFFPRFREAMDSMVAEANLPADSMEAELQEIMTAMEAADSLTGAEFIVARATGRIIHEQIRNFGRGTAGLEPPGEPQVVEVVGVLVRNDYIAVTIRDDEIFTWQNDVEYLRIFDTDSERRTFIYIDGNQPVRTGTCTAF